MINFEKFVLNNGLTVIVHPDTATPMAAINILYNVGAKDEEPDKTGFAHLFEHLMFGGSINIPDYDEPLQMAGGENNAYTTNDLTDYYIQLPSENLETAFWLESDRMLSLAFSKKSLDVQRKVVCEEFKEHYLTKPYGDVWNKMRALAYTTHPYQWMTIGKELSHIENAQLKDVKKFFKKFYCPQNAVMVVAGNVTVSQVKLLAQKWFETIPAGKKYVRNLPIEPPQTEAKKLVIKTKVPLDALYKTWHCPARLDEKYYSMDLMTDILGSGASSILFESLVKEKKIFSHISCFHFGSTDAGLVCIEGKIVKGTLIEDAENELELVLHKFLQQKISEKDLQKVKNKTESALAFEDMSLMNRANSLAYYETLGRAELMNEELEKYAAVTTTDIFNVCQQIFKKENCNTIYYLAEN